MESRVKNQKIQIDWQGKVDWALVKQMWSEGLRVRGKSPEDYELMLDWKQMDWDCPDWDVAVKVEVNYLDWTKVTQKYIDYETDPEFDSDEDGIWSAEHEMHISAELALEWGWFGEPEEKTTVLHFRMRDRECQPLVCEEPMGLTHLDHSGQELER